VKQHAPPALSGQIDSLVAGEGQGGIASTIGGMFGKTEAQ
jgi:hypothetical protein